MFSSSVPQCIYLFVYLFFLSFSFGVYISSAISLCTILELQYCWHLCICVYSPLAVDGWVHTRVLHSLSYPPLHHSGTLHHQPFPPSHAFILPLLPYICLHSNYTKFENRTRSYCICSYSAIQPLFYSNSRYTLSKKLSKFSRYNMQCRGKRDTTENEIFRIVSRFPRYISCSIAENWLPLGQCALASLRFFTSF